MRTIVLTLSLISFPADLEVDAIQFGLLIRGLHGVIHDVTFAFEGSVRPGDEAPADAAERNGLSYNCDGRYSFRSDGVEFLDFSKRGLKVDSPQYHSLEQNLSGLASLMAIPDRNRLSASPPSQIPKSTGQARPIPLRTPASPHGFFFFWYFGGMTDPRNHRYEFQGWEEVDGHRCLRAEIDFESTGQPEHRDRFRMWIDMERGGHPLKVEYYREGKLFARSRNIRLHQYQDSKGVSAWLPIAGQYETFLWQSSDRKSIVYHRDPVVVETHTVVTGSVVLNQGLKDADLTVASHALKYSEFKGFKDFKDYQKQRPRALRTDPKGVQKRLDDALADADSKAERLLASAPDQGPWTWSNVLSLGLPSVGFVLLVGAGVWKWKSR